MSKKCEYCGIDSDDYFKNGPWVDDESVDNEPLFDVISTHWWCSGYCFDQDHKKLTSMRKLDFLELVEDLSIDESN